MRQRHRRSQKTRVRTRRRSPLWTDQSWSRWLSPSPLRTIVLRIMGLRTMVLRRWAGSMRVTVMRRSLIGTFPTLIDGAAPMICWILGAVVTTFFFAIALLCMVYLVESLMVPFIRCQWFPLTWILASEKSWIQLERSSGIEIEGEIVSFSMRMLFLRTL